MAKKTCNFIGFKCQLHKRPCTKSTFYAERLKQTKLKDTFCTKKASKKDASVIRFLHLRNFRLFRGLEYSNETNVKYRHSKLIELKELIEQILRNIY